MESVLVFFKAHQTFVNHTKLPEILMSNMTDCYHRFPPDIDNNYILPTWEEILPQWIQNVLNPTREYVLLIINRVYSMQQPRFLENSEVVVGEGELGWIPHSCHNPANQTLGIFKVGWSATNFRKPQIRKLADLNNLLDWVVSKEGGPQQISANRKSASLRT